MSRTVALIIQYGSYEDLHHCLDGLMNSTASSVDVCIVDNNPPGVQDTDFYTTHFPTVRALFPKENLGFSGGCNVGLHACMKEEYDFFIIINNDAQLDVADISRLEHIFDTEDRIGIVGPIVRNELNDEHYLGLRIDWTRGKTLYNHIEAPIAQDAIVDVDLVSGCGMMLSRRTLEAIQKFDERYFLYWEDTEINMRVRDAGYRTVIAGSVCMDHRPSQSTGQGSRLMEYYMTRNALLFFSLHTEGFFARRRLVNRLLISRTTSGIRRMLRGEGETGKAQLLGVWDYLCGRFGRSPRIDHGACNDSPD